MTTSPLSPVELAKQGDARAIASLINRALQPKGITAKTALKDSCLQILLEGDEVPDQAVCVSPIYRGVIELEAACIQELVIYGRQTGEPSPAWRQKFQLPQAERSPAEPLGVAAPGSPAPNPPAGLSRRKRLVYLSGSLLVMVGIHLATLLGGDRQSNAPASSASSLPNPPANSVRQQSISSDTFEGEWMLMVDRGELRCDAPNTVVFTAPDGAEYGVNAAAKAKGYTEINVIMKNHPETPNMKTSIVPLLLAGLRLCK